LRAVAIIRTRGEATLSRRWTLAAAAAAALTVGVSTGLGGASGARAHRSLGDLYLGPQMARAEIVVVQKGVVHDFRLDQGRVTAVGTASIDLLERDGMKQVIPLSPSTKFIVSGAPATLGELSAGMVALTIRDGDQPAERVRAHPPVP
jgi:hypothetical protein